MAPPETAGEDIGMRRRRLRFRAWHRGTRELDLILGPFADAKAAGLVEPMLGRMEALLELEDTDLLRWLMGQEVPPADADVELLDQLIAFRATLSTLVLNHK
jgi:antitoxin CptB